MFKEVLEQAKLRSPNSDAATEQINVTASAHEHLKGGKDGAKE